MEDLIIQMLRRHNYEVAVRIKGDVVTLDIPKGVASLPLRGEYKREPGKITCHLNESPPATYDVPNYAQALYILKDIGNIVAHFQIPPGLLSFYLKNGKLSDNVEQWLADVDESDLAGLLYIAVEEEEQDERVLRSIGILEGYNLITKENPNA